MVILLILLAAFAFSLYVVVPKEEPGVSYGTLISLWSKKLYFAVVKVSELINE